MRIHDDPESHRAAERLRARAFAYGTNVYFGRGEYAPRTPEGRHVLLHELGHVVERRGQTPLLRLMRMGTGKRTLWPGTEDERDVVEPPPDEKPRVQAAINRIRRIVDDPKGYAGCHRFFKERSPSGETLRSAFNRAVVWKAALPVDDDWDAGAKTVPGGSNIVYFPGGYSRGEEGLAEVLLHELGHVAGIGLPGSRPHTAADEIRVACMAGAPVLFHLRAGVDTRRKLLLSFGFRWLVAAAGHGRDELRVGADGASGNAGAIQSARGAVGRPIHAGGVNSDTPGLLLSGS